MQGLVDTHAHLDEVQDLRSAISRAKAAGITRAISMGQGPASNIETFRLAAEYPGFISPAIGLHPWAIGSLSPAAIEEAISYIKDNLEQAIALGEVGLDYDKRVLKNTGKSQQQEVLRRLLALAAEQGKPVSFHSRYAWKDSLQLVKESGVRSLVFHWYTGFSSTLNELMEGGYYISATPAAEYHDEHRRAVREAPLNRIILETDCPVEYGRGEKYRSEPADLLRSLRAAASIKCIGMEELAVICRENTMRLFGL
jgi:TatD DNase family protein